MLMSCNDDFAMKSSKNIEISKSSLVGLKAELCRKQEEVQKAKAQSENEYISVPRKAPKETILTKQNAGVTDRNEKDIELSEEEIDMHKKSREMLETKSRLYDKLQQGKLKTESKSPYLVDFEQKAAEDSQTAVTVGCENKVSEDEFENDIAKQSDDYSSASDSEDDWVDYVDCFGRTRRCLRRDLIHMKSKDCQLSESLQPPKKPVIEQAPVQQQDMLSTDMQREAMRQKWEEQERKLLEKGDIHYQDILFNEARNHGVGYYNFSVDEDERIRQQAALLKLRKETTEEQAAKQRIQALRKQQLQARLNAAYKRRRERLGLSPKDEDDEQEKDVIQPTTEKEKESSPEEETVEDMERALKRAAHVRPWDVGKDGVKQPLLMTQEEWVEKKREERPSQFAPPSAYTTPDSDQSINLKRNKISLFFTSKKTKRIQECDKQVPLQNSTEGDDDDVDDGDDSDSDYGPSISDWRKQKIKTDTEIGHVQEDAADTEHTQSREDISDSISAGLDYLRQQADIKQKKKEKGMLDII